MYCDDWNRPEGVGVGLRLGRVMLLIPRPREVRGLNGGLWAIGLLYEMNEMQGTEQWSTNGRVASPNIGDGTFLLLEPVGIVGGRGGY